MIIDFHTHCFPPKIAQRAIDGLSDASGGQIYHTNGTTDGLLAQMERSGVTASVVLNIATNEHQQHSVNDFAASINNNDALFSFGSVFPDSKDALEELDRIDFLGLKGVKLHPDYQHFYVDDPKMKPIYQKISRLGLIVVFHAGFDFGFPPPYGATPERLAKALRWLDTPVVAAHWGGLQYGQQVIEHLCGLDLYFDTSFGYGSMPKCFARQIVEKHGVDKLLFGTDTPWHTPEMELRMLDSLGLSNSQRDRILFGNAARLLKIK